MKRRVIGILFCVLAVSLIGLTSCNKSDSIEKGTYYLATESGTDKTSYIEVINDKSLVFNNIDATDYIEGLVSFAKKYDGEITIKDTKTGEKKQIILKDATTDELDDFIANQAEVYVGEKKYRLEKTGDIQQLYVDVSEMPLGEYIPKTATIIIGDKSYVLGK